MCNATNVLYRLRWLFTGMLLLCFGQIVAWGFDRKPPLELVGWNIERPVYPGGPLRITLAVQRDMSRECDATVSRHIQDGRGFRFDLPQLVMDSHAIAALQASLRDENRILVQMPDDAAPGPAKYVSALSYACNPVHRLWPMRVRHELPFEITLR